ncbi:hypothetical protein KUTeg_002002 [Tegillarca granosa]|uniref:Uncharacterized protein n=1 Tax=Tegillarca granosa TaxID=220873 RepID=A0ABQ9FXE4_TEGGR|nr:hypothetical protein KUTeg_002002 [Tegillarca granosa]
MSRHESQRSVNQDPQYVSRHESQRSIHQEPQYVSRHESQRSLQPPDAHYLSRNESQRSVSQSQPHLARHESQQSLQGSQQGVYVLRRESQRSRLERQGSERSLTGPPQQQLTRHQSHQNVYHQQDPAYLSRYESQPILGQEATRPKSLNYLPRHESHQPLSYHDNRQPHQQVHSPHHHGKSPTSAHPPPQPHLPNISQDEDYLPPYEGGQPLNMSHDQVLPYPLYPNSPQDNHMEGVQHQNGHMQPLTVEVGRHESQRSVSDYPGGSYTSPKYSDDSMIRRSQTHLSHSSSMSAPHPVPEGIEKTKQLNVLLFSSGGRDRQGGPVITFPPHSQDPEFTSQDITTCLRYLSQIPSEESKRRGFTAVVDSRDGSWQNLVTVLGCLKPQFLSINRLYTFVDKNQLSGSFGGHLIYIHRVWLQNRLDQEKFIREVRAASSHLDSAEASDSAGLWKAGTSPVPWNL